MLNRNNNLIIQVAKITIYFGFSVAILAVVGGCVAWRTFTQEDSREGETARLLSYWSEILSNDTGDTAKLEMANAIGRASSSPIAPYLTLTDALGDDRLRRSMLNREPSWFAFAGLNRQLNEELKGLVAIGEHPSDAALHVRQGIGDLYDRLIRTRNDLHEMNADHVGRSLYVGTFQRILEGNHPFHHLADERIAKLQTEGPFFTKNDIIKWEVIRACLDDVRSKTRVSAVQSAQTYPELLTKMKRWQAELDHGVEQYDFLAFLRVAPERLLPPKTEYKNHSNPIRK